MAVVLPAVRGGKTEAAAGCSHVRFEQTADDEAGICTYITILGLTPCSILQSAPLPLCGMTVRINSFSRDPAFHEVLVRTNLPPGKPGVVQH